MGNSCSSGQAHKDKDNVSQRSEESPSYQLTVKKPSTDTAAAAEAPAQQPSPSADSERDTLAAQSSFRGKPTHAKLLKGVASSSISADSMSVSSSACAQSPACPVSACPLVDAALELPGGASALPTATRRLILGRADSPLAVRRRTALTVYICAADSQDCCVEKGVLHTLVAPALRKAARRKGWRLHVADLHWRSPLEQQRHHGFPMLCTAELARQSEYAVIVPVLFLNSSLGTSLLPLTVESSDFRTALAAAPTDADRHLLNTWYKEENTAVPPCFRLVKAASAGAVSALSVLLRTLPLEARDAYLTTVVEQEVHNTVLMSTEAARRCVWVSRVGAVPTPSAAPGPALATPTGPAPADPAPPAPDPVADQELQRRLQNLQKDLKIHLSDKNILRCTHRGDRAEYLESVRSQLGQRLAAALEGLAAEEAAGGPAAGVPGAFLRGLAEQCGDGRRAAQCAASRDDILADIGSYVCGGSGVGPLTLCGPAGSGKTCLAARAATLVPTWLPDAAVIVRFVGVGTQSGSSRCLLKSLVDHCSILANGGVFKGKQNLETLQSQLTELLSLVSQHRPLVLVITAVDELDSLEWLPKILPDNVKFIITCKQNVCEGWPSSSTVPVHPLPSTEARDAVRACAAQFGHYGTVTPPPDTVKMLEVLGDTVPLHSKVLAWQSMLPSEWCWESKEPSWCREAAGRAAPLRVCGSLAEQLGHMLAALEGVLGETRVRPTLALISVSRRGLSDDQMLDLLAHDPAFISERTYLPWAPAALVWVQMATLLAHFLRWDSVGLVRERDAAFHSAIVSRYWPKYEQSTRRCLIDYFEGKWSDENDPKMAGRLITQENKFSDEYYNQRKLEELPFQYYHLYKDDLVTYSNMPFFIELTQIHDRLAATSCTQFLEDLDRIRLPDIPEHITILREFLEESSYAIDYDCRQVYSLLGSFLSARSVSSSVCLRWKEFCKIPPVPSLVAKNLGEVTRDASIAGPSYDLIVRLEGLDNFVAALSTDREELSVWDVVNCRKVRTLLGVTQPINLVPIDQFKCVVLCRRELRVYDLDKGTFLTTLKGVMNQKMPYYGLHDKSHLVCLSRNRMYVNLMNTETGDCVTTFKAGEDRFLNSLLVSGDGRILVCGDETQKPFPLLVWSLTSRKLLYDLRIPHHEFITTLAAITHEGSYVCVVARELDDEPGPNFIVVYDLQSGTLFKKWKPGADTTAIAITSAAGCVAAALADTRILVWDLVTGNCRCSLRGHSAAATQLRLSARGAILLSRDANNPPRDPSVRLWDLNAGKTVAVYTPPSAVSSCELLGDGRSVAVALQDRDHLLTLDLREPGKPPPQAEAAPYGAAHNQGKVFRLKEGDEA